MDRQRQRVRTNKASKTTTLHADHAFPASGNFLTAPWILSIGEQISSFFFFFSGTVLSDSTPDMTISPTFDKFNETYLTSMKFVTVRIHFLSDVFGLLSCRNFATMAT